MIDWLKFLVPLKPQLRIGGDTVLLLDRDGEVKWQKIKPDQVRGSWEATLQVCVDAFTGDLQIDGNPVKYFQGHNLFGSSDCRGLVLATFLDVAQKLSIPYPGNLPWRLSCGDFTLRAVHINHSYALRTLDQARAARDFIEENVRMERSGRGERKQGHNAVYFRKHSRRESMKVYCKADEAHLTVPVYGGELGGDLLEWVQDKLRIEVVVRSMALRDRGLEHGTAWCDSTADALYTAVVQKLEFPMTLELPAATLLELPARLRLAYDVWRQGGDLTKRVSRASFYRYRKELLEHGIDIAMPRPAEVKSNVVPFMRRIELVPAGVPDFAKGTAAYFEPRRLTA